ncbi:MAG: DNA topoisomerase, partial [Candidatus Bathyarchaeota archaeon]
GVKTVDEGWTKVYKYVKPEQHIIPEIQPNTVLDVDKIEAVEKQTKPPPRYNNASLVSEMEKAGIGTKATRAEIVRLLFRRGYIYYEKDVGIKPTRLGEKIIEISQKYCPIIIDVALTSQLEQSLDLIMENKSERNEVLDKVRQNISRILNDISHNLDNIGKELISSI